MYVIAQSSYDYLIKGSIHLHARSRLILKRRASAEKLEARETNNGNENLQDVLRRALRGHGTCITRMLRTNAFYIQSPRLQ